ncbi:sensor histidine kinase [Terriglobus sp. TAA 43]|uniref:sensor histidine kinase n=1 Tax=Terriglobus sp. TAA 43 TaxID=278961 RepID=UPI0006476996|nr:sensor histidine kinase [Terriglobus sp. TAA 43]
MKLLRTFSVCLFLLWVVTEAKALNPDRDIHQLAHRSWTEKEGYPGRAEALAQTADGFLWIGTDDGLFRFDGVRFERYVPVSGDRLSAGPIRALHAFPDGSLWITYRFEYKICVLRNGALRCYGEEEGVTSNPTTIVQDHSGAIWANTEAGLLRLAGTRWEHIGKAWEFPEYVPSFSSEALFVDREGTLWVGVNHTILYLEKGTRRFKPTGVYAGLSIQIAEAPDGTLWVSDVLSYVREISKSISTISASTARCEATTPRGTPLQCPTDDQFVVKIKAPDNLLFDRNGSLWVATDSSGVARVSHSASMKAWSTLKASKDFQTFTSKDGLSADSCTPILEDHEGNIWVATQRGLDQFHDTALVPVPLPSSLYRVATAPADNGSIWVVGSWAYVAKIDGELNDPSWMPTDAFKLYRDQTGATWLLGSSLARWNGNKFQDVVKAPFSSNSGGPGMWNVARDSAGTLWAFAHKYGFFSLEHDHWKPWITPTKVTEQRVATMFSDSVGRVWVSTYEGDILTMNKGTIVDYSDSSDKPRSFIKAFAERSPQRIWGGDADGLLMIEQDQFRRMNPLGVSTLGDVTGIVDAGSHGVWLNTARGVIHISAEEVEHALADRSYHFRFERFDSDDGIPGRFESVYPYPKAIQGTDGRIWFTATKGVAWIDPRTTPPKNTLPPPVSILSVSADNSSHLQFADLRFPAHTANLRIDYTALSLSIPERVRFRYQLEGVDRGLQNVDTRRQAFYTNLGPGDYKFRVLACNNDGVWNEVGAVLTFAIAPAFYQTAWFLSCCALAFLLLIYAAYLFRIGQLKSQFAATLEARVDERTRIARDLHDTLLQSFNALLLRIQTVSNVLPDKPDEAKRRVEAALEQASEAVAEGRDTLNELRTRSVKTADLDQAIANFAKELSNSSSEEAFPEIRVQVEGTPVPMNPIVRDEVYRIVTEALRNAIQHADAKRIDVQIRYDAHRLRARIGDNGKGIDPSVMTHHKDGHWGLIGMKERAKLVGGTLEVWSQLNVGTEIELTVQL